MESMEMSTATLTSKGQMTLPKDVRDDLGLKPGDRIDVIKEGERYVLRPRTVRAADLAGILGKPPAGEGLSPDDMDQAITDTVAKRFARKLK